MGTVKKIAPREMWYSLNDILSYNRMLNFIIGNRGGGKSFECKRHCIQRFIQTGEKFIYMRRYASEIKKQQLEKFFDDIAFLFKGHDLKVVNGVGYCDGKEMVYFIALSKAQRVKSTSYLECTTIIFDEFLIQTKGVGSLKYMQDEVEVFAEFIFTVNRLRGENINGKKDNLKILLVANNISITNPYFDYFNIHVPMEKGIYPCRFNKQIVVEYYYSDDYISQVMKTRVAELFAGTKYFEYAVKNKTLVQGSNFIAKRPPNARFHKGIIYDGVGYGFWMDKDGIIYMDKTIDKNNPNIFPLTTEDHQPNLIFYRQLKKIGTFRVLIDSYDLGEIRFMDDYCADVFTKIYNILK